VNLSSSAEDLLRELAPQVLGVLARRFGDFADAEDAVQEALLSAALHWPVDGVPDNPRAWLLQVGQRKLTDLVRSDAARRGRESAAAPELPPDVPDRDDSLALLFLCCHPSLTPASAIPLTLRAFGGLTTAEIARGLLVPEPTMAQRISRAKQRIRSSGLPFGLPDNAELPGRLRSVLQVLYLIFNEGYASSSGAEVARTELSAEAIRLCRSLAELLPDDPEVTGLLALMLLTDARRPARTGAAGELVPLAEQDRSLWSADLIAEGVALVTSAMQRGRIGDYQLQAAIAALHDEAPSAAATDWRQILGLYGLLERMTGNPVVTLNRAIAAAMVDGPAAGLALLEPLDEVLRGNHRLDAVRGHLLEQAGDLPAAVACYRSAAARTTSIAERSYLLARAARIDE
jgi:RNA polymerase sigma factor (sigma-70 family)